MLVLAWWLVGAKRESCKLYIMYYITQYCLPQKIWREIASANKKAQASCVVVFKNVNTGLSSAHVLPLLK